MPDALPFRYLRVHPPAAAPKPVTWFCRLTRALAEGDHAGERVALAELDRVGFSIRVDRALRKVNATRTTPRFVAGGAELYGAGSGGIRAAQPCGTIGLAGKKQPIGASTPRPAGDSEALGTPRIAASTAPSGEATGCEQF